MKRKRRIADDNAMLRWERWWLSREIEGEKMSSDRKKENWGEREASDYQSENDDAAEYPPTFLPLIFTDLKKKW
ncbi:hypothetical protein SLE2022_179380 [Rubroshorea leprosula]